MKRKILLAGAALCAAIAISGAAQADVIGMDFPAGSAPIGYWDASIGYEFQANSAIDVVGLAALNPVSGSEQVGLWDAGGNLLASTTVTSASTQIGTANWSYNSITPIALTAGDDYYVAAVGTYSYPPISDATFAPQISYVEDAYADNGSGFVFPNNTEFGTSAPDAAFPGGNVVLASAAVPEPITLSLFGAGLAGAVAMRRRKKTTKA